jgi:hypothetical protein
VPKFPQITVNAVPTSDEPGGLFVRISRALYSARLAEDASQFHAKLRGAHPSTWDSICKEYVSVV